MEDLSTVLEPELEEHEQEHGPRTHINQDMADHLPIRESHTDKSTDPKDRIKDALHHQQTIDKIELLQEPLMHTL